MPVAQKHPSECFVIRSFFGIPENTGALTRSSDNSNRKSRFQARIAEHSASSDSAPEDLGLLGFDDPRKRLFFGDERHGD